MHDLEMNRRERRAISNWRRLGVAAALTLAGPAVIAGSGCTSDDNGASGTQPPDPGGTFGSDITVRIVGGGHVSSNPIGIDCPTRCFSTLLFDPASAAAKTGVALTASPTPGWTFAGWSFDGAPVAGRAREPEECQPYTRPATVPKADTSNPTLTLTPGVGPGTAPTTKAPACSATSSLPLAYQVTATFTKAPDEIDAGDAGDDSGTPEGDLVADRAQVGATGRKIFARSGRLYWQWDTSFGSGISTASSLPGSLRTDLATAVSFVSAFDVDQAVAYQVSGATTVTTYSIGSTIPTSLPTAPPCVALATDLSYAYCRQSGATNQIVRWTLGGTGPVVLASKLPTGSDVSVDATSIYYSDSSLGSVYSIPLAGVPDGGTPSPTLIADLRTSPGNVQVYSSYVAWIDAAGTSTSALLQAPRTGGGTVFTLAAMNGIRDFVIDTTSSYVYFTVVPSAAPGASSIVRVPLTGGATTVVKSGLYAPGGVAVDSSYVYWTNLDGKVFRALKF